VTIESLDRAHAARPFRPFSLSLPDGRTLRVPRPESIVHCPGSRIAVVVNHRNGYEAVDVAAVVSLSFEDSARVAPEPRGSGAGGSS
jgi:hypothetical protein